MNRVLTRIIGDKKQWKAMEARAAALPRRHRSVYAGIKTSLWKVSSGDGLATVALLDQILGSFEASVRQSRDVLEVTGPDVAAFCDERLRAAGPGTQSYTDRWRSSLNRDLAEQLTR